MEQINLTATKRAEKGTNPAGRLRSAGLTPAILYGPGIKEAMALSLDNKILEKVLHTTAGGNVIVSLNVEGEALRMAMFKEVSRHPLKGSILHVDLLEVLMDHKITVEVPVHIVGKAEGLAFGGIVQVEHRKVKVECLPNQIPDSFELDVTPLGVGQSLHVKDLALFEGLRVLDEPEMTIVSIVSPTAEVAPKSAEEVEAELAKSFEEKEKEAGKKEE